MEQSRMFAAAPPPRCCAVRQSGPAEICGRRAWWRSPADDERIDRFWCDYHRKPGDVPIAGELQYRRVCLAVQIYVAATDERQAVAHDEAYEHIWRAVKEAGGLLNVIGATSETGRATFHARRQALRMAKAGLR